MGKRYCDLTAAEKEYIRNSYLDGVKLTILASKFHVKTDVMRGWLRLMGARKPKHEVGLNPNPPTQITETLIHNYYIEDIKKHMSHQESLRDICTQLCRTEEYVCTVLARQNLIN